MKRTQPVFQTRVQVRDGVMGGPRHGTLLALVWVEQLWAVVKWDDEDDPETFKWVCLEEEVGVKRRRAKRGTLAKRRRR